MTKIMYHYTSVIGHKGIIESKLINPSLRANNPKDARFGDGQYVSDIIPGTKRPSQLSRIFFGTPFQGRRFTHQISLNVAELDLTFGRANVYLILNTDPLDISDILIAHGVH